MSILVPDILDEIMSYFAPSDLIQFRIFTSVCREFLYASRRNLRGIRRIQASSPDSVHAIANILSSSVETISSHIRSMTIGIRHHNASFIPKIDVSVVVSRCSNVTTLGLQNVRLSLHGTVTMASLSSLRLASVELDPPSNILDVINSCPRIVHLSLVKQEIGMSLATTIITPLRMESLELHLATGDVDRDAGHVLLSWWSAHPGYVPRLRRLNLYDITSSHVDVVEHFLEHTAGNLERLSVFVRNGDGIAGKRLYNHPAFTVCDSWIQDGCGCSLYHYSRQSKAILVTCAALDEGNVA